MACRLARLARFAVVGLALAAAPRALSCMPGCSGYHLTFTGPQGANGSALATADRNVAISWEDSVDGAGATFDILMSRQPVPAYPMHSFPAQLPGQVLALGLSATAQNSWSWDTSQVEPGTAFLYAVFHNSPFNTLVMPFAAVTIAHGSATDAEPAFLIRSPRGTSAIGGTVSISLDAAAGGSTATTVDLYVGSPPDAADGTLVASGLTAGPGQSAQWDSSLASAGSYVFKAVLRDPSGTVLASALSPGIVEVDPPSSSGGSCQTGAGPLAFGMWTLLWVGLRPRRRPNDRRAN
jgi:hypothetical protein